MAADSHIGYVKLVYWGCAESGNDSNDSTLVSFANFNLNWTAIKHDNNGQGYNNLILLVN